MIDDYLRRQDGVVTLSQTRLAGLSDFAVRRRVQSGRWRRCGPGVYFAVDRPFTAAARIRAAVWARGTHAVGSGLAAAWWLGLTTFPPELVEVTVPRNSHGRPSAGCVVRRRDLDELDISECRGVRVTAAPLTVLEAAVRRDGGPRIMDSALQQRVSLTELQQAQARNAGRYGSPAARLLLLAAERGARSQAERVLVQLLRSAGISGWTANYPVGPYAVDIAFPEQKIAIEVDGWAFHSDREAFQKDRARQNRIALMGWQVLRFTWLDLTQYPHRVLSVIRDAIRAR